MGRDTAGEPADVGPVRLGAFVGRHDEVRRLRQLVASGTPLITVTGLSGVGKTRLVREALGDLIDAWLSAADLDNPAALLPMVEQRAEALSASSGPDKQLMVIDSVDNATLGREVIAVTDRFRRIQVVVSSQTRLNVRGETLFRLEPLAYPKTASDVDLGDPSGWPAIDCFMLSARRVRPDFELTSVNIAGVVELVRTAGGLPLAIDLVANWLRLLAVHELVEQARGSLEPFSGGPSDLPPRQQDLGASILATVQTLPTEDLDTLIALAHLGAVSLEGLRRGLGRRVALDSLGRLIDRNLVEASGDTSSRLSMHPTVRRVVASQSDGTSAQWRFLEWVAPQVADYGSRLTTSASKHAFATLDDLTIDIDAALDLLALHPASVAPIIADLSHYWWHTRQCRVAVYWAEAALAAFDSDPSIRTRLHHGAARALGALFDHKGSIVHATQALSIAQQAFDNAAIVRAFTELLRAQVILGHFDDLGVPYERAVGICEENDLNLEYCELLTCEAERLLHIGLREQALVAANRAVQLSNLTDDVYMQVVCLHTLAYAHTELGDYHAAMQVMGTALELSTPADPRCALDLATYSYRTGCLFDQGLLAEAVEQGYLAVAGYEQLQWPMGLSQAAWMLAEALSYYGQADEARRYFIRAIEVAQQGTSPFRIMIPLVAVAITTPPVRPALAVCDQILRTVDSASPGFLNGQSGAWARQLRTLRRDIETQLDVENRDAPLTSFEQLVDATLGHLRGSHEPARPLGLSRREIEVLRHLALGETDREIADQLHVGTRTVNTHVSTILRKLAVDRRRQAAAWARANLSL